MAPVDMYTASIAVDASARVHVLGFIRGVALNFSRAFSLGFFEPALVSPPIIVQPISPTLIEMHVHAEQCSLLLLRILWGMCEWGRLMEALPFQWLGVRQNLVPLELDSMGLPTFMPKGDHLFTLIRPQFIGLGEQMVVLTEFSRPLSADQIELLESGFETWAAMVRGGLPPEGSSPGESEVSATSGYFIATTTYQWIVEAIAADVSCIDLMIKFFDYHATHLAVTKVEIET